MARFNKGWVKAWRDMVDGDLPQNIWLWGIWNWLLLAATWKPSKILWKGKQREIPPGTVVMGLGELAAKWECSKTTIKKWLIYLEESERISLEMCSRGTIVTIRNWDVYQSKEVEGCPPSEHEVSAGCPPGVHEVNLNEEVQEGKKIREREEVSKIDLDSCIEEWGKTLFYHKIQKDPKFDELNIARLIQSHGVEKTYLALLGARFEEKSQDYDPSKHVNILRLFTPKVFETFVNLGAQHKPTTREYYEADTTC